MAPIRAKRTSLRARSAKPAAAPPPPPPPSDAGTLFPTNKRDKRTIKHNALLSRVRDAHITKQKKPLKRRRPSKKLTADIGGLADALPDVDDPEEEEWEGISDDDGAGATITSAQRRRRRKGGAAYEGKMVLKTLRHRPGAMKRKKALEGREMERFGRNLAAMADAGGKQGGGGRAEGDGQSERWKKLRDFIGGTMVKDKAFSGT